ncbi:MAG: thiamine-phosphate kinase [Phycisphaerae bacterium]|nr:thiamine-phosphate kinase [Phycisphaerae bacterium]
MEKSENNLVDWISGRFGQSTGGADDAVLIGLGDDMAMIRPHADALLVAADMIMDGVDFDASLHSPEQIGRKALAVNLSDCAAMAVQPRFAIVSLALPNEWTMEQARRLFEGMDELALQYGVRLIGGDTNSWDRPLVADVTIMAEPWPGLRPVTRRGARPGDLVCVTGSLGGSLSGRHLAFEPRVNEAKWLAEELGDGLHAMMDLSDGLSIDGRRLCESSGVGMEIREDALESVASDDAIVASRNDGRSIVDHVLNDGEDFELLHVVDVLRFHQVAHQEKRNPLNSLSMSHGLKLAPVRPIGVVIEESGLHMVKKDGSKVRITSGGWQHFT